MTDTPPSPKRNRRRPFAVAFRIYRSAKRALFSKTRLGYERSKQFFMLPGCYRKIRAIKDCGRSRTGLAFDLLTWFFSFKTFPNHYGLCRLWEVGRNEWKYYYGSNYLPHQLARLKRVVQPLEYRILFNDKYVCVLICQALGFRAPRTYGVLDPSLDYRAQIDRWLDASSEHQLIIKPLLGEMGRDIVVAMRAEGKTVIRTKRISKPLKDYVLAEKAIVQDIVAQDARMAAFSSTSVNTLRVVTMLTRQNKVLIVNAIFRSGVGSAFIDNWSAGGVAVGVDCTNGRLLKHAYDKNSVRYLTHPESGVVFEDFPVPEWDRICALATRVQEALPFYRLLGLDMAIDRTGEPVIVEINGAPDLGGGEQMAGPMLQHKPVLRAFGEYGLLVNKHQRKLYASLDNL
jgi:hypothetical protein